MSPGNDDDILPFSNGEEFIEWAGLQLGKNILGGIASAILGEIWDAIFGSGKTAEELLKEAVELFSEKVEAILGERDLDVAIGEFRALMHGFDNLGIRIDEHGPSWWGNENLREELLDELRNRESHAINLMAELSRDQLSMPGWPTYMMVGSLLLRIYATRMSVPEYAESERRIIDKDIDDFVNHHWDLCAQLRGSVWSAFKSIKKGHLVHNYSFRVPELSLGPPLFNINSGYTDHLNRGLLSRDLLQAFEVHGISLTTIRVITRYNEWLITDEVNKIRYIIRLIRQTDNLINVYRLRESPNTYYDIIEARELIRWGGYYFEVNTRRLADFTSGSLRELIAKIPPVEHAIRAGEGLRGSKLLPGNSAVHIRPVGNNQYWIFTRRWAVFFIPAAAGSGETIRERLAVHKYGLLFWLWTQQRRNIVGSLHDVTVEWWAGQEPDKVRTVAIRAPNGKYVTAGIGANQRGELIAWRDNIRPWSIFQMITKERNKIALCAQNKLYVASELYEEFRGLPIEGELVANKNWIKSWETFHLIDRGNNKVAFRAANGRYVSAIGVKDGVIVPRPKLIANSNRVEQWEIFEIVPIKQQFRVLIKAVDCNNTYEWNERVECRLEIFVDDKFHSSWRSSWRSPMRDGQQWCPPIDYIPFWTYVEVRLEEKSLVPFRSDKLLGSVFIERIIKRPGELSFISGRANYKLQYFVDYMD
jgi:hypothetical protein